MGRAATAGRDPETIKAPSGLQLFVRRVLGGIDRTPIPGLAIVVCLVLVAGLPFSLAVGETPDTHTAERTGGTEGSGWVAINVTLDGAPVRLTYQAHGVEEPYVRGMGVYDEDHDLVRHITATEGFLGGAGVHVDADPVDGDEMLVNSEFDTYGDVAKHELTVDGEAETVNLFMWLAGDAQNWSYELEGDDIVVNGATMGEGTFLHEADDFESALSLQVYPAAGAWLDASSTVHAKSSLIGIFFASSGQRGHTDFYAQTPAQEVDCSCSWVDFQGDRAPGPGDYTFHANGANVARYHAAGVLDARLPIGD